MQPGIANVEAPMVAGKWRKRGGRLLVEKLPASWTRFPGPAGASPTRSVSEPVFLTLERRHECHGETALVFNRLGIGIAVNGAAKQFDLRALSVWQNYNGRRQPANPVSGLPSLNS